MARWPAWLARARPAWTRRRGASNPHVELAGLIRDGDTRSPRYVALCVQVGLFDRALEAAGGLDALCTDRAHAAAYAAAHGDVALAGDLLARVGSGPAALDAVRRIWHLVPDAAARWLAAADPQHPALAGLRAAAGLPDDGRAPRAPRQALERAEQALWLANRADDAAGQLAGLNAAFEALGQAPVRLRAGDGPLSVGRLGGLDTPAEAGAAARRVSVVMTSFDSAGLVGAAMRSVLYQTWPDLELIVVDDASTDASWHEIQALARADRRVVPVRLARNAGTYAAKNVGLQRATGELVAFQDADDWAHPQRLEDIVRALQVPGVLAVSGHYVRLDDRGRFVSPRLHPLIRWTPNALGFRREPVLARIGYFDENRFGSDSEYVARLRAAFGEAAHRKLPGLAFVASHREGSLMTGAAYGPGRSGHSSVRRAFEAWWSERLLGRLVAGEPLRLAPGERTGFVVPGPPVS